MSDTQTTSTEAQAASTDDSAQAATTTDTASTEAQAASTSETSATTTSTDEGEKPAVDPQVKELRSENAATRRKLREAEEKLAEIERAKLSDLEKAQQDKADAEARAAAAEARNQALVAKSALTAAASEAKLVDPSLVHELLAAKVEFDEDGEPTNVSDLIAALVEAHPTLVQTDAQGGQGAGGAPGAAAPSGKPAQQEQSREDFLARFGLLR